MTNADKYLKDGVTGIRNFLTSLDEWYFKIERQIQPVDKVLSDFLNDKVKPTLTEDEKVILKLASTEQHKTIKRSEYNNLFINNVPINSLFGEDLFQFIKPRRRI